MQLRTIESKIDYKFNDKNLLQEALTHSSLNLTKINYQRLEFLGDRVLGLIISEKIFNKMPDLSVGEMHLKFESLTNEKYLSKIAEKIGLKNHIKVQPGIDGEKILSNNSILSDVLESIIGAIFLDGGIDKVKKFILNNFQINFEKPNLNSKSLLQQKLLAQGKDLPVYLIKKQLGPDHDPSFVVRVMISEDIGASGSGKSLKLAEQKAANNLLKKLYSKE